MSRIVALDLKTKGLFTRGFLRFIYFMTRRKVGRVVMPVQAMAHQPRVLWGYGMMEDSLAHCHLVDEALKELAQVRVATLVGCPF
jgi:hypothetical protein